MKFEFNIIAQRYDRQQDVTIDPRCNGWTARNIGDTPATVNGIILFPPLVPNTNGESFSAGGNLGEIFAGRLTIIFLAPAGTNPLIEIIQKFYLPDQL